MNDSRGTPKTLAEAINNALSDTLTHCNDPKVIAAVIETHVRDFLAQRFSVALVKQDLLDEETIIKLWQSIVSVSSPASVEIKPEHKYLTPDDEELYKIVSNNDHERWEQLKDFLKGKK